MYWIKNLIVPNRYDCFFVALATIGMIAYGTVGWALAFSNLEFESSAVLLVAVAISFVAIGAAAALGRHSPRRSWTLFAVGAIVPPASVLCYSSVLENQSLLNRLMPAPDLMFGRPTDIPPDWDVFGWTYCGLILVPLGSWIIFSAVHVGPTRLKRFLFERFHITRTKLLATIAGSLLLLSFVGNILRVSSSRYSEAFMGILLGAVGIFLLTAINVAITYLPTRFLLGRTAGWIKFLVSFAMLGLCSAGLWLAYLRDLPGPFINHEELIGVTAAIVAVAFYPICIVGLASARVDPNHEIELEPPALSQQNSVWRLPSLWGVTLLLLLGGLVWLPFRYDLGTLASGQDWDVARKESKLRWDSNGQIRRTFSWGGVLFCAFDGSTPPDVFSLLDGDSGSTFIFSGDAPQVDFSRIGKNPAPLAAQFDEGQITTQQLNDFLVHPANFIRFGGCNVVHSGIKISPHSIDQLYFVSLNQRDPQFAKTMAQFETFENVSNILIQQNITADDWDQIVRASDHATIRIMGERPIDLTDDQLAASNRNIAFAGNLVDQTQANLTVDQWRWLDNSNIVFEMYWNDQLANGSQSGNGSELYEELVFAFPHRFQMQFGDPLARHLNIAASKEDLFVFERDSNGNPTGLWLPYGQHNRSLSDLTELKILSFDETWLQLRGGRMESGLVDLSQFAKLEHLCFASSYIDDNIDFLANLKSLKHLQIPTVDRSSRRGRGFDSCPSLESITMLGRPDVQSIVEFQRLPNLKKLTIVDLYEEFSDETQRSDAVNIEDKTQSLTTLKTKLPNVAINIVEVEDFTPQLPASFQRHAEQKQAQLRKKMQSKFMAPPEK